MSPTSKIKDASFGTLESSSLDAILTQVNSSGIIEVKGEDATSALFFQDGKLIGIRINNKEATKSEILALKEWKKGEVIFIKWENEFTANSEYLDDLLYQSSLLKNSLIILCGDSAEIHINNGIVCKAIFDNKSGVAAIRKIITNCKGDFQIKLVEATEGDLSLDYLSIQWLFNKVAKANLEEPYMPEEDYTPEAENETEEVQERIKEESKSENKNVALKNNTMNVKKLNEAVDNLKEQLGSSLLACDIWMTNDGQPLAGHNSQPKAAALFERVTSQLREALGKAGFPGLGSYYSLVLENGSVAIILQFDGYQWGILLDPKIQMGLLMNIVIPQAISDFKEAIA